MQHSVGQGGRFLACHPAQHDCHEPCASGIGNAAVGAASTRYPISAADKRAAIALLADEIDDAELRNWRAGSQEAKTLREKICDRTLLWAILALVENMTRARAES